MALPLQTAGVRRAANWTGVARPGQAVGQESASRGGRARAAREPRESRSTCGGERKEIGVEGEAEGREKWRGGRQKKKKNPDLVFPKPSSYIANAWSNMGSFIMDKPLAPACKVYHVHCKEVKDWAVFARNVATTSGPRIIVCRCCECGMQGGVSALHRKPEGLLLFRQWEANQEISQLTLSIMRISHALLPVLCCVRLLLRPRVL